MTVTNTISAYPAALLQQGIPLRFAVKKENKFSNVCLGLGFVILGAVVLSLAGQLQVVKRGIGPGGYPRVVAVMMIILGGVLVLENVIGGFPKPVFALENARGWLKTLTLIVGTLVYISLMRKLGFLLLTPFYMGFTLVMFGHKDWKRVVVISVSTTVIVYLLFVKVFMIFLPSFRLF